MINLFPSKRTKAKVLRKKYYTLYKMNCFYCIKLKFGSDKRNSFHSVVLNIIFFKFI